MRFLEKENFFCDFEEAILRLLEKKTFSLRFEKNIPAVKNVATLGRQFRGHTLVSDMKMALN